MSSFLSWLGSVADSVLLVDIEDLAAGDPDARIAWRKDNAAMLEVKDQDEKKDNEAVKTKAQARRSLIDSCYACGLWYE